MEMARHESSGAEVVPVATAAIAAEAESEVHAVGQSSAQDIEEARRLNNEYITSRKAKSTLKKQKSATNKFVEWLRRRGEMRSLASIETRSLDQLIAQWIVDIRRPDGGEYELNSLNSYVSALKCHLTELGHEIKHLDMTSRVFSAKRNYLKSQGKGNTPNRSTCLSDEQEEQLWQSGALGASDPEALVHGVWYLTTKCLGFRGCNEARQLKWGDIVKKQDDNGMTYLEWNERLTKTRSGNTNHQRPFAPKIYV